MSSKPELKINNGVNKGVGSQPNTPKPKPTSPKK